MTATDNGTPPLTDTNSFILTVLATNTVPTSNFRITSFSITNGLATLSWTSIPNRTYHLQYKNTLTATTWTNVLLDIAATGTTTTAHPTVIRRCRPGFIGWHCCPDPGRLGRIRSP